VEVPLKVYTAFHFTGLDFGFHLHFSAELICVLAQHVHRVPGQSLVLREKGWYTYRALLNTRNTVTIWEISINIESDKAVVH